MKSKYTKIKYTNTGVKAPVVFLAKSSPDLSRSDITGLEYPEIRIIIARMSRKTMYNRAESEITIRKDGYSAVFFVHDTINDARVFCENLYLIIKKPELDYRIPTGEYDSIYEYMRGVL